MSRWQRYWFADGGRYALAIVRIAVATSVLLSLYRLSNIPQLVAPEGLYRPVGVWMLLGSSPPPPFLVTLLFVVAWAASVAMLLGLATRATTAVAFVTGVALASVSHSHQAHWSHIYNVVFLAHLALLGARAGDSLSLDAFIRARRGLPPIDVPRAYQWSLRLVQLAVALMFVCAVFHKLAHGHFTLRWALSDNLRHHLMVKYDLAGIERPALVDWLLADVWRYRTAAVLNLVTQLTPLIAVVFARRPLVRLVAALAFITEVIGLGLIVDLWNLHWLPLAAVFIDWDRLVHRFRRPPIPPTLVDWRPPRGPRIFILVFVIYDVLTAFIPTLDQRLNTYPFTAFPMFANIRLREPFDEHMPYSLMGDRFTVTTQRPLTQYEQMIVDHHFRNTYLLRNPTALRAQLERASRELEKRFDLDVVSIQHQAVIFEAPAYPAPARFAQHPIAITGELTGATLRTLVGSTWAGSTITLQPLDVDTTNVRLVYYANDLPVAHDLPATRAGNAFTLSSLPKGKRIYIVAITSDAAGNETRWLVATRR